MRVSSTLALLGLVAMVAGNPSKPRNYDANDYYVLELDSSTSPDLVAARLGLRHEGQMAGLEGHHIFAGKRERHDVVTPVLHESKRRKRDLGGSDILEGVRFAQRQVPRKPWEKRALLPTRPTRPPRFYSDARQADLGLLQRQRHVMDTLSISDPIFDKQWHLLNTLQPGHDLNVTGLWMQGITGKNATVAIVDDGLDMDSDDLKPNYYAGGSYDFNDHRPEPKPTLSDDRHGTRCAGEVAAARNNVCGVGVAYDSKIAGLRILSKLITDADEALAMIYDFQHNDIYSCSWGPPDDGRSMDAPGILIKRAMLKGVQEGRGGLGSIYVFASGNGANKDDNCNFDGYTNSIYSITVGAIDRTGQHPYYSERCSAQMVVAYSSGAGDAIHTTDVGQNTCYDQHGGTSAAAPLGAGVYALVLSVRPDLTWRDLQWLQMDTAVPVNVETEEWQDTAIGKKFSHTFGYGKIDAYAIVEAAKTWKKVKPQSWYFSPWVHVNQAIPQGNEGLVIEHEVTADALKDANLERVEHVTVTMNVNHTRRGDLSVDLISPEGVVSHIATARENDQTNAGYDDWTFMTVAHWGESGVGNWKVIIKDGKVNEHSGTFVDFHLKLWGESIDAAKATKLPMPSEDDDKDHAKVISSTTTMTASTTVVTQSAEAPATLPSTVPTDQPDRPKIKPTSSGMAAAGSGVAPTETSAATQTGEAAPTTTDSNWISWLPSFGVSGKAQVWIYGAVVLIVAFCVGLVIWLFMARRRKLLNNPRDDYEFELLNEEESQGLNAGEKGVGTAGAKTRRTRGGELYDAFAGGSDDEDGFEEGYTDQETSRRTEIERRRLSDDGLEEEQRHVIGDDDDSDEEELDEKRHGQSSRAV
ncbi:KEX1 protease [Sodiomyces alkalinus F11]|uniref:KEX1 protease n=1 Tax=Sodiomyces alkalinus (strain CBS 110278 / VKM F-3762 / F11) TaxID=1314773 RepID=A0A3N2PXZ8_SODAK|nr:KEX1 protease [Sodiomyces alkalinus F11]ROT39344.1 KEX1 protease [Sodiomyces alkalinus F11]